MTKPNSAFARYFTTSEGKLLTYERLQLLVFDSVRVTKIREGFYTIDVSDSSYNENDEQ